MPAQTWEESQQEALGKQWGLPNDLPEAPEKLLQSSQGPVLCVNMAWPEVSSMPCSFMLWILACIGRLDWCVADR